MRYALAGIVTVALAFGAYAIGHSNSSNSNGGVANAAQSRAASQLPGNGAPRGGQPPTGQLPRDGQAPPGFGTPVSGATAAKAKTAALAKYKGTVERVMKLDDGSYVVHVITSSGEYHVAVSKDFKVTRAQQGDPGPAAHRPPARPSPAAQGPPHERDAQAPAELVSPPVLGSASSPPSSGST